MPLFETVSGINPMGACALRETCNSIHCSCGAFERSLWGNAEERPHAKQEEAPESPGASECLPSPALRQNLPPGEGVSNGSPE